MNDFNLTCPAPIRHYPQIVLGHGSGGRMMQDLLEYVIYKNIESRIENDAAVLKLGNEIFAMTTDSFVVSPLFFPGGDIGSLAVHGTVNDLTMMGAVPKYLSLAMIIEEGLEGEVLEKILKSIAVAAKKAGVQIVTGDTKVVEKGHGDQIYINTTGVGLVPHGRKINPTQIKAGDKLIVNGTLGDHGMTIMSLRQGIEFETNMQSDSAPLNGLVEVMLLASSKIHCMRDITRGGLAAVSNELAKSTNLCLTIDESQVPVNPQVASACEMLGIDPFQVANEGKLLAVVAKQDADKILAVMKKHKYGKQAAIIGEVTDNPKGMVLGRTVIGGERVIDFPPGVLLPRIC